MTQGKHFFTVSLMSVLALLLSGCPGDSDDYNEGHVQVAQTQLGDEHDHEEDEHEHESESGGRLVFGEVEGEHSHVYVYDLETEANLEEFEFDHAVSAIHASPAQRYALIAQRDDSHVNFIDGGLWSEEHDDHAHVHEEDPLLLAMQLDNCIRPTHYEAHEGLAALFCDGLDTEELPASVNLLSDASIGNGQIIAEQVFPTWMHGTAEPRGDWLLATHRESDAEGSLPNQVDLYELHGDHFHHEHRFATLCDGLHGSFSNHDYSLFGCTDGVLVIHQEGDTVEDFHDFKLSTPHRISQLAGHHELEEFAGFSGSVLYAINPEAETATEINWRNGADIERVAHAMDAHGEHFLILDDEGTLHILDPHDAWQTAAFVTGVATAGDGDPAIRIALSHAEELAFITDPANERITIVNLEHGDIEGHINPGFAPFDLTWLGIAGEDEHDEHVHEESEEEHDHEHDEAKVLEDAAGNTVELEAAYLVVDGFELVKCTSVASLMQQTFSGIIGTAMAQDGHNHGHDHGGGGNEVPDDQRNLNRAHVINLMEPDEALLILGNMRVEQGRYCKLRLSVVPAQEDAFGMPDDPDMMGKGFHLQWHQTVGGEESEKSVDSSGLPLAHTVTLDLEPLSVGENHYHLVVALNYAHILEDIDLSTISDEDLPAAVLEGIAHALEIHDQGVGRLD